MIIRGVDLILCVSAILKLAFSVTCELCDNHNTLRYTPLIKPERPPTHGSAREHMVNTLSLRARLWNLQSRSIFLLLLAGVALQDVLLPSLSPIFLLTQILARTGLGDEPGCDLVHHARPVISTIRTATRPFDLAVACFPASLRAHFRA